MPEQVLPPPEALAASDSWLCQLTQPELEALLDFCDLLLFSLPDYTVSRRAYLEIVGESAWSTRMKLWAGLVNGHARSACCSPVPVLRSHAQRALGVSRQKLLLALARLRGQGGDGPETVPPAAYPGPLEAPPDPAGWAALEAREFVCRVHEAVLGRACRPAQLREALVELQADPAARGAFVQRALAERRSREAAEAARRAGNGAAFHVMGTGQYVTEEAWHARARQLEANPASAAPVPAADLRPCPPRRLGRPCISVITSLYRGGAHIERFLANMVAQTAFGEDVEVLIVDAASPEGEASVIERWARGHPSIRLLRCHETIGIYAAWNLAIAEARGDYLTNANVDDLRREDSLALQAAALDRWPEVDVVYQDFYYTMDPSLSYAQVAAFGYRSTLPDDIDADTLMRMNPPHHAPMWRARLHRELGPFDETFRSAGDYEFWMRCLAAGRRFRKLAEPHAVYYQNPAGVSTRPSTRGHAETRRVLRRHGRRLLELAAGPTTVRYS